jgi:hypothetical protein
MAAALFQLCAPNPREAKRGGWWRRPPGSRLSYRYPLRSSNPREATMRNTNPSSFCDRSYKNKDSATGAVTESGTTSSCTSRGTSSDMDGRTASWMLSRQRQETAMVCDELMTTDGGRQGHLIQTSDMSLPRRPGRPPLPVPCSVKPALLAGGSISSRIGRLSRLAGAGRRPEQSTRTRHGLVHTQVWMTRSIRRGSLALRVRVGGSDRRLLQFQRNVSFCSFPLHFQVTTDLVVTY